MSLKRLKEFTLNTYSIIKLSFLPSTKEGILFWKSLMAELLNKASQWHEMCSHDLEVMSSNPGQVELGVHSTSVLSSTGTKYIFLH